MPEHINDDLGAWQAAYDNIRSAVDLLYPEGHPVPEFLLHIRGDDRAAVVRCNSTFVVMPRCLPRPGG